MIKFLIPTEVGNDVVRSGKIKRVFDELMGQLKPENAYFYAEDGIRAGHMICQISDEADLVTIGEAFWFGLGAEVDVTPVMNVDDLQKGLGRIPDILRKYDD
jgi:hypothetical protein